VEYSKEKPPHLDYLPTLWMMWNLAEPCHSQSGTPPRTAHFAATGRKVLHTGQKTENEMYST